MKQFKRILCAVLAVLMLALTLSACNGATGGKLTSDSDGSVLKINLASEPDYLDPALSSAVTAERWQRTPSSACSPPTAKGKSSRLSWTSTK